MTDIRTLDTIRFVWRHWMRFPRTYVVVSTLICLMAFLDVLLPVFAGRFVDAIAGDAPLSDVWPALALVIGTTVSYFTARYVMIWLFIRFATRVMRNMVSEAFERVQRFSAEWHGNAFAGATVRKIGRGMWAYDTFADTVMHALVPAVLTLFGLTIMLALHWPLMGALVGMLVATHLTVSYWFATYYLAPTNQVHMEADTAVGAAVADAITCNAVVKSFGTEGREDARFRTVLDDWAGKAERTWHRSEHMIAFQVLMQVLIMGALLGLATMFWAQGAASPGDVALALTTFFVIDGHLRHSSFHIRQAQQAVNELEDLVAFERMPLGVADRKGAADFKPARGDIRFEHVRFAYRNKRDPLYEDFSLEIAPGERVGLVGRSGSGKSTFVKLLQRLHDVDAGRIVIDGQDISQVTQASLRRAIALVPQDPVLFHRSLAENIAYARPDATYEEIVTAAKRAHAHEFIEKLHAGYETEVGERGVKLSGGERQRIAIARAFLADAPILVLDEATSSLDSHTEHLIQVAIGDLMRGRTTILIAHRLSTIRDVDRILVFRDGRVVEQGTHRELMAQPEGHFRALHDVQARGLAEGLAL